MSGAYLLSGQDNGSTMFAFDEINSGRCGICNAIIDFDCIPQQFKLEKTDFDISYTYDGVCIVSKRFKCFCEENGYPNVFFSKLPNDNEYVMKVENVLRIDTKRTPVELKELCGKCNTYRSATIHEPIIFEEAQIIDEGIYRTDLSFGDAHNKAPILIIGLKTFVKMKKEKFSKAAYREIKSQ